MIINDILKLDQKLYIFYTSLTIDIYLKKCINVFRLTPSSFLKFALQKYVEEQ